MGTAGAGWTFSRLLHLRKRRCFPALGGALRRRSGASLLSSGDGDLDRVLVQPATRLVTGRDEEQWRWRSATHVHCVGAPRGKATPLGGKLALTRAVLDHGRPPQRLAGVGHLGDEELGVGMSGTVDQRRA